jgi:hypothetical protein
LLEDDDRFFVGEAEGGGRTGVESEAACAELASSAVATLLQHLHAELARAPEKCICQHISLVR